MWKWRHITCARNQIQDLRNKAMNKSKLEKSETTGSELG